VILVVNGTLDAGQDEVARRLVARLPHGAIAPAEPARLVELAASRVTDFVIPGVFPTWSSLRSLRRELAPVDATSYAFCLTREPSALSLRAVELQRCQEAEALEGDVGLPVPDLGPEEAAQFIWDDVHEPVELVPWDDGWAAAFATERASLLRALGGTALLVEHVGSTAIDGLRAKPVIDIVVAVPRLERTQDYLPALRELGYHFLDYPTNVDRYFFKKGRPRTHHLHVAEPGRPSITNQVRFRDALRARPELRARYATLKEELERRFPNDRARYSESKGAFIARALADDSQAPGESA
jgi:GrpB-like predicted nucleotidyltransferase (UPF0157 family)